jgi:putative transposase
MQRRRSFSREFKLEVCQQLATGERRPAQICREHHLAASLLSRWRQQYEQHGELAFSPGRATEVEALERQVADLERFCGQLALENQVLKKLGRQTQLEAGWRVC